MQERPAVPRHERILHGLAAALLASIFIASAAGASAGVCLMHAWTGLPCVSCGMTRSFCALAHGGVAEAVAFHPLGPVVFMVLAAVLVRSAGVAIFGRPCLPRLRRGMILSVPVLALAALVIWSVRLAALFASGDGAEVWWNSPLGSLLSLL
jgi:hypothetical protein